MASKTAKFAYTDTTSPGKILTCLRQTALIQNTFKNKTFDGVGLCIPGYGGQLKRHIDEHLANGIREENLFMIDWDWETYWTLRKAQQELGFKGQVVEANLINQAEMLWALGHKISLIDFDDVKCLQDYHIDFLEKACKNNVEVIILVVSTRGGGGGKHNTCIIKWMNRLGIKMYEHRRGNMAVPYRQITEGAVRFIAKRHGYTFNSMKYQGLGNHTMVSCVLTKN